MILWSLQNNSKQAKNLGKIHTIFVYVVEIRLLCTLYSERKTIQVTMEPYLQRKFLYAQNYLEVDFYLQFFFFQFILCSTFVILKCSFLIKCHEVFQYLFPFGPCLVTFIVLSVSNESFWHVSIRLFVSHLSRFLIFPYYSCENLFKTCFSFLGDLSSSVQI